jgi:hypothetical protein
MFSSEFILSGATTGDSRFLTSPRCHSTWRNAQILITEASALLEPDDVVFVAAARSHGTAIVCVSGFVKALDLVIANARTVHFNQFFIVMTFRATKCYSTPMISSALIFPIFSKPTANWMCSCNGDNVDNGNTTKVVEYGSDPSDCTSVSMPASRITLWKSHSVICCKVKKLPSKTQGGKCLSV